MKAGIVSETLIVAIGHDEALRILDGETVGDRINPINPESKIVFKPFVETEPEYAGRDSALFIVRSIVQCAEDFDCAIYVPPEVLEDAFMGAEHLSRDEIVFNSVEHGAIVRNGFPLGGVTLRFDNGIGDPRFFELTKSL